MWSWFLFLALSGASFVFVRRFRSSLRSGRIKAMQGAQTKRMFQMNCYLVKSLCFVFVRRNLRASLRSGRKIIMQEAQTKRTRGVFRAERRDDAFPSRRRSAGAKLGSVYLRRRFIFTRYRSFRSARGGFLVFLSSLSFCFHDLMYSFDVTAN